MKKLLLLMILSGLLPCFQTSYAADDPDDLTGIYSAHIGISAMLQGPVTKGDILFREGLADKAAGDYSAAFGKWNRAIKLYRGGGREGDGKGVNFWELMTTPGLVLIAEAKDQSEKAVATLIEIGHAHLEINEFDQALHAFRTALSESETSKLDRGAIPAMIGLAAVYGRLGDNDTAMDYLQKAERKAVETGDQSGRINVLNGIGELYLRQKNFSGALEEYRQSLAVAKEIHDEKGIQSASLNMGISLAGLGRHQEALKRFEESISVARIRKDIPGILNGLNRKGECLLELDRLEEARFTIREGSSLLSVLEVNLPEQRLYASAKAGRIEARKGNVSAALSNYLRSIEDIENIRSRIASGEHRAGFFEDKIAVYEDLIDLLMSAGDIGAAGNHLRRYGETKEEIAFYYAESTRARTFLESLSGSRMDAIAGRVPADIMEREKSLLNRMAALQAGGGISVADRGSGEDLHARTKAELNELIEMLKKDYPDYAAIRYPEPVIVRNLPLRTGEALLSFKVNRHVTYAWLVRKGRETRTVTIPVSRDELTALIREFRESITDASRISAFDPKKAENLYRLLLRDLLREIDREEQVIIVPDGPLAALPFDALITDTSKMAKTAGAGGIPFFHGIRYLGDEFRITYYPSASIMTLARRAGGKAERAFPLFALGDPVYDDEDPRYREKAGLEEKHTPKASTATFTDGMMLGRLVTRSGYAMPRLPETRDEVLTIAGLFGYGESDPHVRLGLAASKSEVLRADLAHGRYLHFATHGLLGGDIPYILEPALVMTQVGREPGDDGFLKMSDVLGLRLNADMVVLSACKTALGKEVTGEGVVGLSRAFMLAGSRSVVVSLWSVESNATAILMKRFYEHLKTGKAKGEALRLAKRELREGTYAVVERDRGVKIAGAKTEIPGAHPFFWAPFVLTGEWE